MNYSAQASTDRTVVVDFFSFHSSCVLLLCIWLGCMDGRAAGRESGICQNVKSKWIARQNRIKSFDIRWESEVYRVAEIGKGLSRDTSSRRELFYQARGRFALDQEGRLRFDTTGRSWSSEKNMFVPLESQQVFDGVARTRLFLRGSLSYPFASITGQSRESAARTVQLLPLRMTYRILDEHLGVFDHNRQLQISGNAVIRGRKCVIIRQDGNSDASLQTRVYADVARDYLPLRYESFRNDKPVQEAQVVEFTEDTNAGWIPAKWTVVRSYDTHGKVSWSDAAHVTFCEFNEQIDDKVFAVSFPMGTWVSNRITDERYLLKEGQERRPILHGEFDGTNYEELLVTKPGEAGHGSLSESSSGASLRMWVVIGSGVLILLFALIVTYRKLKA